jgi:hypothetical protein
MDKQNADYLADIDRMGNRDEGKMAHNVFGWLRLRHFLDICGNEPGSGYGTHQGKDGKAAHKSGNNIGHEGNSPVIHVLKGS